MTWTPITATTKLCAAAAIGRSTQGWSRITRWRRAQRLTYRKVIAAKPAFHIQITELDGLFRRACARSWALIKEDATIKSNLLVEGTAGALAARRGVLPNRPVLPKSTTNHEVVA